MKTPIYKAELHRHLDCSMRFTTMVEIATKLGLPIPNNLGEQKEYFLIQLPLLNLGEVLQKFERAQTLLHSTAVLERLAYETVIDAHHEGLKLLELRYAPTFIQAGHANMSWDQIHEALLSGIKRALQICDMAVGLIVIIQRTLPQKTIASVIDFIINNKKTIIGVDLADNEDGYEASLFEATFQKARSANIPITIHAGEIPTTQSIRNIEDSILKLGAQRIGHGIQCIHSVQTLKLIRDHNVTLEVCPTSNYLTQVVKNMNEHPLRFLYNEGIRLTINTDDPGIFNYGLKEELNVVQNILGFSIAEIKQFQLNAYEASFIETSKKLAFEHFFKIH